MFVDKGAMYDGQRGDGKERTAVGRVTDRVVVLVAPIVRVPETRLPLLLSLPFIPSLLSRSTNDDAAEECQWRRPPPSCWFSYPLPMRKHPLEEHEDKKGYWALPRRGRVQRPIMRPLLALPTRHSLLGPTFALNWNSRKKGAEFNWRLWPSRGAPDEHTCSGFLPFIYRCPIVSFPPLSRPRIRPEASADVVSRGRLYFPMCAIYARAYLSSPF